MGLLLLIILGILLYLLWPLIRVYLYVNKAKKQSRDFFDRVNQQYRSQSAGSSTYRQPRRRHKKIDPSVGEYVEFEEIKTASSTASSDGGAKVNYTREEQVTDVEWEDL